MQPTNAEELAQRLGNVAAILIDLGRKARLSAEHDTEDTGKGSEDEQK